MKAELEPIYSGKDESFYSRRFAQAAFDHPLRFHPEVEVVSILKSSGSLIVGDSIGSFQRGGLFLLGSNLPHVFSNGGVPGWGIRLRSIALPWQYFLNELRLGHACRELGAGDATVTEIAFCSGFRNLSNIPVRLRRRSDAPPHRGTNPLLWR